MEECTILKDSKTTYANNTVFESGAIRSSKEGKGRYDLVPWLTIAEIFNENNQPIKDEIDFFMGVDRYINSHNETCLLYIINWLIDEGYGDYYLFIDELAKHFERGAEEYGENNWKKGIPEQSFIDSGMRHMVHWLYNRDPINLISAIWNFVCLYWTMTNDEV